MPCKPQLDTGNFYFQNLNDSTARSAPEMGKFSDAEQIEGKEMAKDQLWSYKCAAWVIFLFPLVDLAAVEGKLRFYPSAQWSPVDITELCTQKSDSATRINAHFPAVAQMWGQ